MTTLTERYVEAATRTVPDKQRADLADELRTSIADQVDARVAEGATPVDAERAVLTELGDPDRLAAAYVDRPLYLIGPRYYLMWWRLLKLLLAIVPACAAFGVALGQVLSGASFGQTVGTTVGITLSVVVHVAFWTTVAFVIIERSERGHDAGLVRAWTPDDLPEHKDRGAGVSDVVASLVFLGVAAGAVLWDRLVGFVYLDGTWMPFLDPQLWPWWTGALLAIIALEALLMISVFAKGRWDLGSATINLCLNAAIALPAVWLLMEDRLVNPEFFLRIIPADSAETVSTVVRVLFGFGIVAIATWDSIDAFRKARRGH